MVTSFGLRALRANAARRSLVRAFALRSALVFVVVGVVLHLLVQQAVGGLFHQWAEFHAQFVVDTVVRQQLARLERPGGIVADGEAGAALREFGLDGDVVGIKVWAADGTVVLSDDPDQVGRSDAATAALLGRVADGGLRSEHRETVDGRLAEALHTFVPTGHPDAPVAEVVQDWAPTRAEARAVSGRLNVSTALGLALLWVMLLPIARRAHRRAQEQHLRDRLTGLPTWEVGAGRLEHGLRRAQRSGAGLAVLFVDLDGFKQTNDLFGHSSADAVLREVAGRLAAVTRATDTVVRFAGDEFIVVVEDAHQDSAVVLAERLVAAAAEPSRVVAGSRLTASVGVALADAGTHEDAEGLLRRADLAMYRAKALGGDRWAMFDEGLRAEAERRQWLEQALGTAVTNDELEVAYQPFYAQSFGDGAPPRTGGRPAPTAGYLPRTGGRPAPTAGYLPRTGGPPGPQAGYLPVAVEALVRWQHPTKGAISPGEFIPVAESAGLVCGIGEWVLRRVCLDVASWQHDLPEGFRVHVNLSPAQLSDGHFLSLLDHWLARTGADPNRLGFEITETVILDDHDAVRTVIAGLKQRGCHVALDDFGTGYSSLAHLRSVPLDLLKIDRAFVADLEDHSRDRAIVAAVAGLAQELGVPVLAEGVETEAQLTAVRALGVDLVQGFLLARPAPGPSIERLLGITPRAARAEGSPEPLVVPCAGAAVRPLAVGAVH